MNDDFFPDSATEAVGQVMHFIHHHVAKFIKRAALGVEHVAQHFGGHDNNRRLAIDARIAGEQTYLLRPMPVDEVVELLVRQRLDRRGVETLAPGSQSELNSEFADDGLSSAGGSRDQNASTGLKGLTRFDLETVETEFVCSDETRE